MSFNYHIVGTASGPGSLADLQQDLGVSGAAALISDVNYALKQWSNNLTAPGTLNVEIQSGDDAGGAGVTRSGALRKFNDTGVTVNGKHLEMTSGATALLDTQHTPLDGSGADLIIRFDHDYLHNELFLDPTPDTSNDIPANKTDAVSVIEHELAHGFGIDGFYPRDATTYLTGPSETTFDRWVGWVNNGLGHNVPKFFGPNAMAANNGQPVPLTYQPNGYSQNIYHLGNAGQGFTNDMMNGEYYLEGHRYQIGALDKAIIKDVWSTLPSNATIAQTPAQQLGSTLTVRL
jgi:hypothetical protein